MNPEVQQDGTQLVPLRSSEAYPTVPLSTLTEFATQKMYTELQRIIELLPMRSDVEKKVKLLDFLHGSRVLFIRLLALVRWETSANKVEKCKRILQVLETQSGLLLQTADTLATLSRETLQRARLPAFYLPAAIDVLTMRTYPRLPTIIRDRLTRPPPLTVRERCELVTALNGLIQRRLLREALPLAMRTFEVRDGRVILTVAREFSIEATLFEHAVRPDTQLQTEDTATLGCVWRLLKLRILVVDCDSQPTRGRSARSTRALTDSRLKASANVNALVSTTKPRANWTSPLVHALQVGYLLETAQRYIADKRQPLVSLFECLHSFCISLQLEVLHAQTARLAQTAGSPFVVQPSRDSLRISFWHDRVAVVVSIQHCQVATNSGGAAESSALHAFSSLVVSHEPPLADPMANARIQNALANEDALSIERVLVLTMHTRVVERFKVLQREIRRLVNGACELRGVGEQQSGVDGSWLRPATLCVPIVARCCSNEQLRIGIDIYTNEVHLACAALRTNTRGMQLLGELERLLGTIDADCNKAQPNTSGSTGSTIGETMKQVATILGELRLLIALARCEASLTFVSGAQPRFVSESELALRFGTPTGDAVRTLLDRRVAPRSATRALVAVPHHDAAFLVIAPLEVTARKTIAFDFYLLHISATMPTLLKVDHGAFGSALAADRQHTTSRTVPESIIDAHSEEQLAQMTTAILSSNSDSVARARPTLPNSFAQTQLARRLDRKRRLLLCVSEPNASKRPRQSVDLDPDADFEEREWRVVPDLTSLLDFSSERLSFLLLSIQLQKQGMCIDRVTFDSESGKCSVNVLTFPQTDAGGELDCRVVECTIRRAGASSGWIFTARIDMHELLAPLAPLASSANSLSSILAINELYEFLPTEASVAGTVQRLAADWRNAACMFALIRRISAECQSDPDRCAFLRSFLVLEKCTLRTLVFSYSSAVGTLRRGTGANQLGELLCTIQCVPESKSRGGYSLHFSRRRPSSSVADARFANPHCLASSCLESLLNSTLSLTELCVAMRTNLQVLKTLSTLDYRLSAGFISGRQNSLLTDFSLIVVSPLEFVLVYKNTFSIEITLSAAKPNSVMLRERNRGAHETAQMPFDCLYLFKYFVSRMAEASRAASDVEMPAATLSNPIRQGTAQAASPSPIVISVDVFARLFTPVRLPTTVDGSSGFNYPLLEAHCGCALLFRQFQRTLTSSGDESGNVWKQCEVKSVLNDSAMQLDFASDQVVGSLVLRFADDHTPTLQLRIPSGRPPTTADQKPMLGNEHTQALERYFELRIIPQFKPQAVITFVRLLGMPSRFLRDAAQLLRYELTQALLHPQATGGARNSGPAHNLISWCTCVPPGLQPAMPAPGATALAHLTTQNRPRIVSFWQFRRVVHPSQLSTIPTAELEQLYEPVAGFYVDRKALTVPLIYDIGSGTLNISPNSLQMQTPAGNANAAILQRVQAHLTRFQQAHNTPQQQLESPLFNALYDLAMYFTI